MFATTRVCHPQFEHPLHSYHALSYPFCWFDGVVPVPSCVRRAYRVVVLFRQRVRLREQRQLFGLLAGLLLFGRYARRSVQRTRVQVRERLRSSSCNSQSRQSCRHLHRQFYCGNDHSFCGNDCTRAWIWGWGCGVGTCRCCSARGVSIALLLPGRRQHVGRVAARLSRGIFLQPNRSCRRHTLPGGVCMRPPRSLFSCLTKPCAYRVILASYSM
jgi:hypothetical protein